MYFRKILFFKHWLGFFIGIIYGAVFASTIAYTTYNWALSKLPAYKTSVFTYLDPVVAVITAVPLLGEKITLPFIESKQALLEQASLFAMVSLYEGFGIPVLEAYVAGVPTVLSDIPVFKELFSESSSFAAADDPSDIAKKMREVLQSKKIADDLVEKGRKAAKKFSWEKCARETLGVLRRE